MEIDKAIKHFQVEKNQLFQKMNHANENATMENKYTKKANWLLKAKHHQENYNYCELAIAALERQRETEQKEPCVFCTDDYTTRSYDSGYYMGITRDYEDNYILQIEKKDSVYDLPIARMPINNCLKCGRKLEA